MLCKVRQKNREKIHARNDPSNNKVRKIGISGCAPGIGAEIHLQPMQKTMLEHISTLQTLETHLKKPLSPQAIEKA